MSTATKAATMVRQLGFLMPNVNGPRQKSGKLLFCVVSSRLVYAAPFWTTMMEERGWKKLAAEHRRSQLRVACCYRTVSYEAAAAVSGLPPIRRLAMERLGLYNNVETDAARSNLLDKWQADGTRAQMESGHSD